MDLTVPYTFYPIALPHRIAWLLFLLALSGGLALGVARGLRSGWVGGIRAGVLGGGGVAGGLDDRGDGDHLLRARSVIAIAGVSPRIASSVSLAAGMAMNSTGWP